MLSSSIFIGRMGDPARASGLRVIKIPFIGRFHDTFCRVEHNCQSVPLASCGEPLRRAEFFSSGKRFSKWSLTVAVSTLVRPKEMLLDCEGKGLILGASQAGWMRE